MDTEDISGVGLRQLQQQLQQANDTIVKLQEQLQPTFQLQSQSFVVTTVCNI